MTNNSKLFTSPTSTSPQMPTVTSGQSSAGVQSPQNGDQPLNTTTTLNFPHKEPIVLLVGPPNVGKTGILASLIEYSTQILDTNIPSRHVLEWLPLDSFISGGVSDSYKNKAANLLSKIKSRVEYIGSTNDYFLLNAKHRNKPAFILVEAPGEDYFSKERELFAPLYLDDIVQRSHKKVYVFVFAYDLFEGSAERADSITAYDKAVAEFIKTKIKPGRDKFLILYTKIQADPALRTGITEIQSVDNAFGSDGPFTSTGAAYRNSPIKDKLIIPYWSGNFKAANNKETRTASPAEYPMAFTEALMVLIKGNPWWRFWK
jgi:hypothetical protein